MHYRPLGRTGLSVSEIGYGAWGIGGSMWIGAAEDESLRALARAVELGVNLIDTARGYGESERITHAAPELIYVHDLRDHHDLYINRHVGELLGYTPAELQALGSAVLPHLMHPDDLARLPALLARFDRGFQSRLRGVLRIQFQEGYDVVSRLNFFRLRGRLSRNENGRQEQ